MVVSDACFVMRASETRVRCSRKVIHNLVVGILDRTREARCFAQRSLMTPRDFSTLLWDFPTKKRVAPWDFLTNTTNRIKLTSNSSVEKSHVFPVEKSHS